ncbi:uncharacterized protein LOC100377900 [Saccoglossus kowalevskii]|uniref:Uncharacterized protein LOC100377900 n=1 Tax=Saccoglossus kowalevskii TaxID=10224 RepID=A0ABM0N003_SACKO|nr:PREDICTED: uncharacterized protein LOC100377900 [Saccoglossus kowalevskii]
MADCELHQEQHKQRVVLKSDLLFSGNVTVKQTTKKLTRRVTAELEVTGWDCNIPGNVLNINLYKHPEDSVIWKYYQLTQDNFCTVDICARKTRGRKLVIVYKDDDGNERTISLKRLPYMRRMSVSDGEKNTLVAWKENILSELLEDNQFYDISLTESVGGSPAGEHRLYILTNRLVICSKSDKSRKKPTCYLDRQLECFDYGYSDGESVFILKECNADGRKYIRTKASDASGLVEATFIRMSVDRKLRVKRTSDNISTASRNTSESGSTATTPEQVIFIAPQTPSPSPHVAKKIPLTVKVAIFAGRPSFGGTWIIDIYITHTKRNPMEIREKVVQLKTSDDHIVLYTRLIDVHDKLTISVSEIPNGWKFRCRSDYKEFPYDELKRILERGENNDDVIDECHQLVISHEDQQYYNFYCKIEINKTIFNIATNFMNYIKPGEKCAVLDKLIQDTIQRKRKLQWLSYEMVVKLSEKLLNDDETGWRRLLIDVLGFDYSVIDDFENAYCRYNALPGELVLRLWYRTKPEEFTKNNLCRVFSGMDRLDLVRMLLDGCNEDDEQEVENDMHLVAEDLTEKTFEDEVIL